MHEREVLQGSGGRRLVKGKWGELVRQVRPARARTSSVSLARTTS